MPSTFDRAMQLMRTHDPQTQEDGFDLLRHGAAEHLAELMAAYAVETERRAASRTARSRAVRSPTQWG